jgi:predicted RNA binding protein YcfA (HicA-like mRNA interferase family)
MKIPRDITGVQLSNALKKLNYEVTRQTGSHMRLTSNKNGEHHITIPRHDLLRVGTLSGILQDVADHHGLTKDDLMRIIF